MKNYLNCWIVTAVFVLSATTAFAGVLDCTGCHAEKNDIRPLDAPFRNISSGGFSGNHRTHVNPLASFASCAICHNNDSYSPDHLDGKIQLSLKINNHSTAVGNAHYSALRPSSQATGNVFFNQTSMPILGRCSNANCHFETTTPTWGSTAVNCTLCHGAPPTGSYPGYVGGIAGSHGRHDSYYNGIANCGKCHSDHTAELNSFSHATSAGRRALSISLHNPQNSPSGTYSKTEVLGYLPSQAAAQTFGSCSDVYCHSPGTKESAVLAPAKTAVWGGTLGCNGCHQAVPATGGHTSHVFARYGVPVECNTCHAATVTPATTISSTLNHVNMKVDVAFSGNSMNALGSYSGHQSPMQKTPGTGYAHCDNVYCHSSGQGDGGTLPPKYSSPKWGDPTTSQCGSCHEHGLHDSGPILKTGSHAKHLKYEFAAGSSENVCGVCHYGSGFVKPDDFCGQCHFKSDALTTKHINNKIEVDFVSSFGGTYNGTPQPGDGYSNCSNIYCHSNGTSVSTSVSPLNTTASWGAAGNNDCNGCHEYPPSYLNGSPKANSHASHKNFNCSTCHADTTVDGTSITSFTKHVNKIYDVDPGAGVTFSYSYASGGGTCSAISCHFNNNATWGTSLKCVDCHSTSPEDHP